MLEVCFLFVHGVENEGEQGVSEQVVVAVWMEVNDVVDGEGSKMKRRR